MDVTQRHLPLRLLLVFPTPLLGLCPSALRSGIKHGFTALIFASTYGHLAVVEALLAKGADREAKDSYVRAPEAHPPLKGLTLWVKGGGGVHVSVGVPTCTLHVRTVGKS